MMYVVVWVKVETTDQKRLDSWIEKQKLNHEIVHDIIVQHCISYNSSLLLTSEIGVYQNSSLSKLIIRHLRLYGVRT